MSILHLAPLHQVSSSSSPWQPLNIPKKPRQGTLSFRATVSCSARKQFDQIPQPYTFAWNSLISAHLVDGQPMEALAIYLEMLVRGVQPDRHTIPRVLKAASLCSTHASGRQIHGHALKLGLGTDDYVVTALMTMYGQFDGAEAAGKILEGSGRKTSVFWTLLAKLYLDEENPDMALKVFKDMTASCVDLDNLALVTALKACAKLRSIHEGRRVQEIARKCGLEHDLLVRNSVLKMYMECGKMDDCRELFDRMPLKDAVSWTTVITACIQNGEFNEALKLFRALCLQGDKPDSFVVTAILAPCARMFACRNGKEIHGYVIRSNLGSNPAVQNALMNMYVKGGCLELALNIFSRFAEKDIISWVTMIRGLSLHGEGVCGLELFRVLEKGSWGIPLTQPAYVEALYACHSACMVEQAWFYFSHIMEPEIEAFALMVGVLARAGKFQEACMFIDKHKIGMHVEIQKALLDGCRIHGNVKLGKRIAIRLLEMEPLNAENYILLSNIYVSEAKWQEVKRLKQTITDMGLTTRKACSWIELRGKIHIFGVNDVSHPRSMIIYSELQGLMNRIREEGGLPDDNFSLHEVDEERECIPSRHSEMLAIAFGLVSVPGTTAIRVTKNLSVCRSCHHLAKMISRIVGREIILKDPNRFHHFKSGHCSCKDCW